jgi:hypothetical protein
MLVRRKDKVGCSVIIVRNQRAQHTLDANSSNRAVPRAKSGDEQRSDGEYTAH